ncbi:MAG: helix-turn-helix transcriptional regulator [Clostridiales bacterium]|nr:helix-turn-helix transcriptional regulator [Clostridiales bacterium]
MKLNEKILYYRKAAKLSQEELAARVGVSRQAVSKWELAEATPEVDKLLALARAFGVTTDELLSEEEPAGPQEQTPPRNEPYRGTLPPQSEYIPPAEDTFDKATGLIGRLIRRYGWLAGVYVAIGGLPFAIIGALMRWGFGAMFAVSSDAMFDFGGFGGVGGVEFAPGTPPEIQQAILQEMGLAPTASPLGGIESFFLGFATVIIVIGVAMMIAGTVLAVVLYRKGNKRP